MVGDWVDRYPESVKALSDAGHEVMNHSNDHAHFNTLSSNQIMQDINTCNQKIEAITKVRPTLFRPPYGEYNDLVVSTVRSMGMEPIQWDVDGYVRASIPCYDKTRGRFLPYIPFPLHILSINGMVLHVRQKGGV